jgi:hypothetical protein
MALLAWLLIAIATGGTATRIDTKMLLTLLAEEMAKERKPARIVEVWSPVVRSRRQAAAIKRTSDSGLDARLAKGE